MRYVSKKTSGRNGVRVRQPEVNLSQELLKKYAAVLKQMEDLRLNLSLSLPHELRTPLNAILGFSQYLVSCSPEQFPEPDKVLRIHAAIYDSALRMQRLVENYLLYAKLRILEEKPEKEKQKLWQFDDILQTEPFIASVTYPKAESVQRQDDVIIETINADIRISERSLRKILEELLDNAFKFSEPGTPIHIKTSLDDQRWILSISDHGCGMTAEQIENIGAYMQFDRKQYAQQGSGLGLVIALLLVQLNDGELNVESTPEQGTTVTVVFNRKD